MRETIQGVQQPVPRLEPVNPLPWPYGVRPHLDPTSTTEAFFRQGSRGFQPGSYVAVNGRATSASVLDEAVLGHRGCGI